MKTLLMCIVLASLNYVSAHDGPHGPAVKLAPHGGVLRDSATMAFELVNDAGSVKIYLLEHDGKAIPADKVEIVATKTTLSDAKKKSVPFKLVPKGDLFELTFEKGSSHRYLLNLVGKFEGKENKAKWQIELGNE